MPLAFYAIYGLCSQCTSSEDPSTFEKTEKSKLKKPARTIDRKQVDSLVTVLNIFIVFRRFLFQRPTPGRPTLTVQQTPVTRM